MWVEFSAMMGVGVVYPALLLKVTAIACTRYKEAYCLSAHPDTLKTI